MSDNINLIDIKDKPKRKYTKKNTNPKDIKTDNNIVIKPEAKKRGRKRGRRKKGEDFIMKPEDVLDYMIRNFPGMKLEQIKDKVIEGLKLKRDIGENYYVLDKFIYKDNAYYYDSRNTILNNDAQFVGFFINREDGTKKIQFLKSTYTDNRTYEEVIADIERIDLTDN